MKLSEKIKKRVKKVSRDLEKLVRDQITEQDHVDTGAMRASITADVIFTASGFELEVVGLDYFAYVSGNYNIMKNVLKSKRYKNIEQEIEAIFYEMITEQIK